MNGIANYLVSHPLMVTAYMTAFAVFMVAIYRSQADRSHADFKKILFLIIWLSQALAGMYLLGVKSLNGQLLLLMAVTAGTTLIAVKVDRSWLHRLRLTT